MLQEHPHIGAVFWASMALWLLAAIAPFKRFMVLAKSHPDVSRSPSFETLCASRVWLMLGRQCAGVLAGCPCCKHADQGCCGETSAASCHMHRPPHGVPCQLQAADSRFCHEACCASPCCSCGADTASSLMTAAAAGALLWAVLCRHHLQGCQAGPCRRCAHKVTSPGPIQRP